MAKRRSRLELYLEVLRAVSRGVSKPTNIMYRCNLSWASSKEILDSLVEQNLVNFIEKEGRKIYRITDEGRRVLDYFVKVQGLLTVHEKKRALMKLS